MIENRREASISLKEIEVSIKGQNKKFSEVSSKEIGENIPHVSFNKNFSLEPDDIIEMKLSNNKFFPNLNLSFKDRTNRLNDELFPLDNSIVSIFKNSLSDEYWPIRMDFKILSFNPVKRSSSNEEITYNLHGILDVDYLFYRDFWSKEGTSYEILEEISKQSDLGWSTNIDNTNDSMVWINDNKPFKFFIEEVTERSFLSEETFLFSFIDFYYNLNYVDIETQLQEDISDDKNFMNLDYINIGSDKENETKLKLSNHKDYNMTNMYIEKYNLVNSSTQVNLNNGYKTINHYYDKHKNEYKFKTLDTISSTGTENNIVLKDMPNQNQGLTENAIETKYLGKLDIDNAHQNYLFSISQNNLNLDFMQKIKMNVILKEPNFSLYRFQKILIELYNNNRASVDIKKENDEQKLNRRLSGEWLITSISYGYNKKNGHYQEITVIKRELSSNYNKRK